MSNEKSMRRTTTTMRKEQKKANTVETRIDSVDDTSKQMMRKTEKKHTTVSTRDTIRENQ